MRLYEFINENISNEAAIKTIIDVLITELPSIYRQLSSMAENYVKNHGELNNGFRMVAGGAKAKWYDRVFFNQLKPALYKLLESLPKNWKHELSDFLDDMTDNGKFNNMEIALPGILYRIGKATSNQKLISAVESTKKLIDNYYNFLRQLESEDDEPDEISIPEEPNVIGQQNSQIEKIVNDVLSKINKNDAGDIRRIIAKSDNKLLTLQKELQRRGITP